MSKRTLARLAALALVAGGLTGCYLPDNYTATITLKKDLTYSLKYEGELVHVAAMERGYAYGDYRKANDARKTQIDDIEKGIGAEQKKDDPTVKTWEYMGNMRHRVVMDGSAPMPAPGQEKQIFFFTKLKVDEKSVTLTTGGVGPADIKAVTQEGLDSKGTLCVSTDMAVVDTNADEKPGMFGGLFGGGCYTWKRTSLNDGKSPYIKLAR